MEKPNKVTLVMNTPMGANKYELAIVAAREARRIAGEAVAAGLHDLGSGPGPVDVLGTTRRRPS